MINTKCRKCGLDINPGETLCGMCVPWPREQPDPPPAAAEPVYDDPFKAIDALRIKVDLANDLAEARALLEDLATCWCVICILHGKCAHTRARDWLARTAGGK